MDITSVLLMVVHVGVVSDSGSALHSSTMLVR